MKYNEKLNNFIFSALEVISSLAFLYFLFAHNSFFAMQCLFFFLSLNIPVLVQLIFKIKICPFMYYIYEGFLLAHFLLGEIFSFYTTIKHYDTFLHFLSAVCICVFGYSIINYYLKENFAIKKTFSFLFGLASEFFWEITEYFIDDIFNTNMQRFYKNGIYLIGHNALTDTMKDMCVAVIGCLFFLVIIKFKILQKLKIVKT